MELFERSAVGFDSVMVVIVPPSSESTLEDFQPKCSTLVPLVVYPPNDVFTMGEEITNMKVYFKSSKEATLYVFKCIA